APSSKIVRERRSSATQRSDVDLFVVRCAVSPAAKQNPNPFVREGAERRVMVVATGALLVVVGARPVGEPNRLVREFVKGLFHEFGAGQSMMDPHALATAFGDGPNARVRLQLGGGVPTRPVGSKGRRQARRTDLAGAREAAKDRVVGMRGK